MSTTRSELPNSEQRLLDIADQILREGGEKEPLPDRPVFQEELVNRLIGGFSEEIPRCAGERIGHYRIAELLGQGGMGAVYRGYDELLDRQVAVKTLRFRAGTLSAEARARLLREARSLAKLDHPGICRVYDFVEERSPGGKDVVSEQFLILELIEGETLSAVLSRDPGFSRAELLQLLEDIARALDCAHRAGVVHRDLKPDNIMLDSNGAVRVMDFGIARWQTAPTETPGERSAEGLSSVRPPREGESAKEPSGDAIILTSPVPVGTKSVSSPSSGETALTFPGSIIGTPSFMSPEQRAGTSATSASDIYSLALIACEAFAGRRLKEGGEDSLLSQIRRGITPTLGSAGREVLPVLEDALQEDPRDRPTALEIAERLGSIRRRPQRRRRAGMIASVVLILLVALGFAGWTRSLRAAENRVVADLPRPVRTLVLPFINQTGDPAMDWVALGLRALVVESLSEAVEVNVVSLDRTVSLAKVFATTQLANMDSEQLLRESGADLLLAASLRRGGGEDGEGNSTSDYRDRSGAVPYVLDELLVVRDQRRRIRNVLAADPTIAARNLADRLARLIDPGAVLKETHSGDPFIDRLYAVATSALQKGDDPNGAQVLLRHALQLEPGFHRARLQRSVALVQSTDWEEAAAEVGLVRATADPKGDRNVALMALDQEAAVYIHQGQFAAAIEILVELEKALTDKASDRVWHRRAANRLSHIHLQREEFDEALALLKELVDSLRDQPQEYADLIYALFRIGVAHGQRGQFDQAHTYLDEALELAREEAMQRIEGSIMNSIGAFFENAKRFDEALDTYQQAEKIAEHVGDRSLQQAVIGNRANLLVGQERFVEGHALSLESLKLALSVGAINNIALAQFNLAFSACALGRAEEARAHWIEAAKFYSEEDWDMLLVSGWIELLEGNPAAVATMERAKNAAGDSWEAFQERLLEEAKNLYL